jgi:hypothetical protein
MCAAVQCGWVNGKNQLAFIVAPGRKGGIMESTFPLQFNPKLSQHCVTLFISLMGEMHVLAEARMII